MTSSNYSEYTLMKILVTGLAGFIGSHLTDKLLNLGHKVIGIDNFSTGNEDFVNQKAIIERVDIRNAKDVDEIFSKHKPEAVFHLAAQIDLNKSIEDPKSDYEINVIGSKNIIASSEKHGVKKFVFSSSAAVYGDNQNIPIKESEPPMAQNQYGKSKAKTENDLRMLSERAKISSVVLRYSNVYGPRQGSKGEGGVVAIFCKHLKNNQPLVIFGTGNQTRDFIYVGDVVSANIASLCSDKRFSIYNISTAVQTSVNDLAGKLLKISQKECKIEHSESSSPGVPNSSLDNSLIKKEICWNCEHPLEEGLEKTWEWFR